MANRLRRFTLSSEEATCLEAAVSGDSLLSSIIHFPSEHSKNGLVLEIEGEAAEKIREYLTEQLAKIGFSEDYSLTKEGENFGSFDRQILHRLKILCTILPLTECCLEQASEILLQGGILTLESWKSPAI